MTTAFVIGWHSHYVHVVHCGYPGHPYYGHSYYGGYYTRHDASPAMSHGNYVWQPHYRAGGQPFTRSDGRQLAIAHRNANTGGAPSGYQNRGPASAGLHGNRPAVGANGAREGMKQIQPIRNDAPTQAALRNEPAAHGGMKQIQPVRNSPTQATIRDELRAHAPNQTAYTGPGAAGAHATLPAAPGGRYQAPNQSMAFRTSPQVGSPQFHAPQISPQAHNAPQMRAMPMPSSPATRAMPHEGGASYAYRSPSMSMPRTGHAPAAHPGGAAHGAQGHGGGGHGSR